MATASTSSSGEAVAEKSKVRLRISSDSLFSFALELSELLRYWGKRGKNLAVISLAIC